MWLGGVNMKKIVSLIMALALTSILSLEAQADLESLFLDFQTIATNGAGDCASFSINDEIYLSIASYHNDSTYNIDSRVYMWNGTSFIQFQTITTNGAYDLESFTINGETYLAVANVRNDSTFNIDSKIYQFYGQPEAKFHPFIPLLLLNK